MDDKYRNGISVVVDGKTEVRKVKSYYRNHPSFAGSATKKSLSEYIGKMGTGVLRADLLLANLDGKGADMKVPNVYVAEGNAVSIDLAPYFAGGESLVYTCTVENSAIASASVENTLLKVEGIAVGITRITVNAGGKEQTAMVTVRKNANDNGWM